MHIITGRKKKNGGGMGDHIQVLLRAPILPEHSYKRDL